MLSRKNGIVIMLGVAAGMFLLMLRLHPIPQPPSYHNFADQRAWLGIPNFGNVASNLAFAVVGVWGLAFLLRLKAHEVAERFVDPRERWPYTVAFFGMLLTAFGSAYYHVAPDNAHLVWDRIPMTIVFGALIAAVIAERISFRTGLLLLPFLIAIGVGSVLQWYASELHGHGDLRFYAAVQAYSTIVLLLALLLPPKYFARLGFCGGGGILCPGESPGACRLSSLRVRPHCQRAYVEASSCGGGGVLDLANVAA